MLAAKARAERDARDIDLINRHADRLNDEAADVLDYQVKSLRRGNLYRVRKPGGDSKSHRVFVVASRQPLIESRFSTVICAPIYTRRDGLATQVNVGIECGLKHDSAIHCDALVSLPKRILSDYVGSLALPAGQAFNRALQIALDLD